MARGFAIPFTRRNGKLRAVEGSEQLRKIIMIAVGPSESTNPWNEAGTMLPLFRVNDAAARALIRDGVRKHFLRLEAAGRASLVDVLFSGSVEDGTLNVSVTYKDLENSLVDTVQVMVGGGA